MRDVLAAHAGQRDVRYRLRDATESTTSGKECVWWTSGAPAPDFPIGSACCLPQRALSVSGVALTGLGSRSRRHVSRARDERRLLGTPRVTTCTEPLVEVRRHYGRSSARPVTLRPSSPACTCHWSPTPARSRRAGSAYWSRPACRAGRR